MVVITVDGKEYELTEDHVKLMKYVEEAQAIEDGGVGYDLFRLKSPTSTRRHSNKFSGS